MAPSVEQHIALDEELRTAIRLIRAGMGGIQSISSGNDFYHLPMLALSSGFERLMKLVICFRVLEKTGAFPTRSAFGSGAKGHNLEVLLDTILNGCFDKSYTTRVPTAVKDAYCIETDPELRQMVAILSRFGTTARYHYLNVVVGEPTTASSPRDEWERLETELFLAGAKWEQEFRRDPNLRESYHRINTELIIRLERLVRALARLFTLAELGDEATRYRGTIAPFLSLRDDELGICDYRPYLAGDADDA